MTMKIKYFIILISSLILFNSCHDSFLTEDVYSSITPLNFYSTENDAQAALTAVYNAMRNNSSWSRQIILAGEYPSEATWPNNSGEAWRTEMDQFTWTTSSTGFKQMWSQLYVLINRANTLLTHIDKISFTEESKKEQIIAEAKFLRGLAYLYLIRFYDNIPLKTEENMNDLYPSNDGTTDAVWSLIFSDLEYAKGKLKAKYSGGDIGRATSGAAQSILAKAYLSVAGKPWNKSEYWSKAASEAKGVIDNSSYGYNLESNYENVFALSNEHGVEYIFSVEFESNIGCGWDFPTFTDIRNGDHTKLGGWSSVAVETDFFESMAVTDKRREKTFSLSYTGYNDPSVTWTYPGNISLPHYNKYTDRSDIGSGTGDYALNFPVIRFSDVLLMYSEAENEQNGPSDNALSGINRVRDRAGLSVLKPSDFTKETLREAIYQERLWELCGEGHAWFDMKRMDLMAKRIKKFKVEAKHYVFPIPQDELDINPNLKQSALY